MQVIKVNATRLQPANPDILEGVTDLIKLSYLNEPSVLHNLDFRYAHDKIYVSASVIQFLFYECGSLSLSSLGLHTRTITRSVAYSLFH